MLSEIIVNKAIALQSDKYGFFFVGDMGALPNPRPFYNNETKKTEYEYREQADRLDRYRLVYPVGKYKEVVTSEMSRECILFYIKEKGIPYIEKGGILEMVNA